MPTNWVLSAEFDPGDLDTGREHGTARAEMTFMPLIPVDPTDRALATELLARYAEAIDAGDFDAVGALLADWVVDGAPPLDLAPLRLDRFGPIAQSEERLRAACLWRYAHHYSAEQAPA